MTGIGGCGIDPMLGIGSLLYVEEMVYTNYHPVTNMQNVRMVG
jgi:hypothetical protein